MQVDFDDANVPSLLSIPLLGFRYDPSIYRNTRARILSSKNPHVRVQGIPSALFLLQGSSDCVVHLDPACELPNPLLQFYSGQHLKGIGSPHTPPNHVWPLAIAVQGLTARSTEERAEMLRTLLKMQCGNGLMHESGGWVAGWSSRQ